MSATAVSTARPDTREMIVVHNTFRRTFGSMPGLVRGVPAGDLERAGVIADFVAEVATGLHHHHSGEDELMWPLLLERASADTELILRMEEQHERIAELEQRASAQVTTFRRSADPEDGECLAVTLTALAAALDEHMAEEEQHVLPIVEQVMTVEEWEALGERGRAGLPRDRLLVQLGFMLQGTSAADRKEFLSRLPLPARIAWRLMGRRRFVREYTLIYGEPPTLQD